MRKILSLVLGLMWALPAFAALPDGYTQLEYIESTGTQYINTGIVPNSTTTAEVKFNNSKKTSFVFGSRWTASPNYDTFGIYASSSGITSVQHGAAGQSGGSTSIGDVLNQDTIVEIGLSKIKVNDSTEYSYTRGDISTTLQIYLFADNQQGAVYEKMTGKVYYFKVWQGDSLALNLIPAKNSSGVVGMYDTVSGQFFTNAGDGEFIAGDPVTDNSCRNLFDKDAEYINAYVNANSGVLTIGSSGSTTQYSFVIPVQPNTKYTLSGMSSGSSWGSFEDNSIGATATSKLAGNGTITTGANDRYLIGMAYASGTQYDYRQTLQIEEGDTATAYVPYCKKIKIATTKYNESAFGPLNTALANAISVVDSVVSNTITQAASIATLQTQKQTRPNDIADDNEKCPAGKKCLLVEDATGVPHWYEIVEQYSRLPDGYTELQWIESTGTQYIDTGLTTSAGTTEIKVVTDFTLLDINTDVASVVLYISSPNSGLQVYIYKGGSNIYNQGANAGQVRTDVDYIMETVTTANMRSIQLNGGQVISQTFDRSITDNSPIYTFGSPDASGTNTCMIAKIRNQKFYRNGILNRDFVPAKNSSGVVGMYDKVSGEFFENAGTGEFIAGDPVAE